MNDVMRSWWVDRSLLYVGRMAEDKGVETIVRAWSSVLRRTGPGCPPLWLVGGCPHEIEAVRHSIGAAGQLREYERAGRIHWWGYIDRPAISALMLRSLVLITHSRYEPGGRVVLEAMTEGLPVIATPHGFALDLIRDWENGFLVPFGDCVMLARRMEHFVRQPLLRNSLGAAARQAALHALDEWRFLDSHCRVYDDAVSRSMSRQLSASKGIDGDSHYFSERRFIPTYPYDLQEPNEEEVVLFAEKTLGVRVARCDPCHLDNCSSLFWIIQCGGRRWVVKWPYSRLSKRPLWDPSGNHPLARPTGERFAAELFASQLPGFLPVSGEDNSLHLLMRPMMKQLPRKPMHVWLKVAATCLRRLYDAPISDIAQMFEPIDRSWDDVDMDEILAAIAQFRENTAHRSEPWDWRRWPSARLAWRYLNLRLELGHLDIPEEWVDGSHRTRQWFTCMAQRENEFPIVTCHGSGDPSHCLETECGHCGLVDGEHIHLAWPGEDSAALVNCGLDEALMGHSAQRRIWEESVQVITTTDPEAALMISWGALLTLEDLCKNSACLRRSEIEQYTLRWNALADLAREFQG